MTAAALVPGGCAAFGPDPAALPRAEEARPAPPWLSGVWQGVMYGPRLADGFGWHERPVVITVAPDGTWTGRAAGQEASGVVRRAGDPVRLEGHLEDGSDGAGRPVSYTLTRGRADGLYGDTLAYVGGLSVDTPVALEKVK